MVRAPAALRRVAGQAARLLDLPGGPNRGASVAVAVSGGRDSLVLLHALRVLAPPRAWRLCVLTVDHGLHDRSGEDAAFVVDHCHQLGIEARRLVLDAPLLRQRARRCGIEAAAREARYEALHAAARAHGCAWIATGHTLEDQAETMLLQLLRGAGSDGRAAMRPLHGDVLRPLLEVSRHDIAACSAAMGLMPRFDPANADHRYLRVAVRARLLPLLEELRPGAARTLARSAGLAAQERAVLEEVAETALGQLLTASGSDGVGVKADGLVALLPGLGGRVVRLAAQVAGQVPPGEAAARAIVRLAGNSAATGPVTWSGGGCAMRRDAEVWWPRALPAP